MVPRLSPTMMTIKVKVFSIRVRAAFNGESMRSQDRIPPPPSARGAKPAMEAKIFRSLSFLQREEELREFRKETKKRKRAV